jgi:3-oxoacyl-(acyl-carrier-protein) synthase
VNARKRVVITGVGAVAPNGVGLSDYRAALQAGKSGISHQEELKKLNFASQIGGVPPIDEDAILKVLPESDYHKLSEAMIYAALASVECARMSGVELDLLKGYNQNPTDWDTGAIIGCGIGGMDTIFNELGPTLSEAEQQEAGRGTSPMGTDIVPKVMNSSVSVTVGKFLGVGGQVSSNSSACNTGTEAIFDAWKHIQLGFAESMYAGRRRGHALRHLGGL